jgi:hypothetical protein
MFNFLKPKHSVKEQGQVMADSALKLWMNPGPKTEADIAKLVDMGCDRSRLCVEMTAFTLFASLYGVRIANAHGKLAGSLRERLEESLRSRVQMRTENEPVPSGVSVAYDSLRELLFARLEHYLFLISLDSDTEGRDKAISYLCDFICDAEPGFDIKFYMLSFLQGSSHKVFDTLSGMRLQ